MQLIQGNSISWPLSSHASHLLIGLDWCSTSLPFVHHCLGSRPGLWSAGCYLSSLVFGVTYSFYQLTWFWSGLFLYCIPAPVPLPKCSQFPFLSLFCCLFSSPIVCFIWVLPAFPLFLSKSCFFQKLLGNEQLLTWVIEDAGSDAKPIHVPK